MKKLIIISALCLSAAMAEATQYSKLSVILAAKQAGRWQALKSWIAAAGMTDEFQNCVYLSDEFPQFADITNAIVTAGAATSAEVAAILEASKDPAVADGLLRRVYDGDMATDRGRVRWHGKVERTTFDTNALVKVQVYADGYTHSQPFTLSQATSIDDRVSAAERKAQAEALAKKRAEVAAKRKAERIALLETNMTAEVSKLMQARRWPEDLATLFLRHELNTLISTNVVNAVIRGGE